MRTFYEKLLSYLLTLRDRWELLPPEEKKYIVLGSKVFLGVVFLLFLLPFVDARVDALRERREKEKTFQTLISMEREVYTKGLIPKKEGIKGGEPSLLSAMEQYTRKAGVSDRIVSMRPNRPGKERETIEIQLKELYWEEGVRFLHIVEEGKWKIYQMEIQRDIRSPKRIKMIVEVGSR
jgi:hypothetical protein